MEQYKFVLHSNESEDMSGEWETANYKWPFGDVVLEAEDIDDAARDFVKKYNQYLNRDWDFEGSDDDGYFYGGNTEDGLGLVFKVTKK